MLLSLPSSAALPGVSSHHRECRAGSAGQKGKDAPCHPEPSPAIQRQQPRRDLGITAAPCWVCPQGLTCPTLSGKELPQNAMKLIC